MQFRDERALVIVWYKMCVCERCCRRRCPAKQLLATFMNRLRFQAFSNDISWSAFILFICRVDWILLSYQCVLYIYEHHFFVVRILFTFWTANGKSMHRKILEKCDKHDGKRRNEHTTRVNGLDKIVALLRAIGNHLSFGKCDAFDASQHCWICISMEIQWLGISETWCLSFHGDLRLIIHIGKQHTDNEGLFLDKTVWRWWRWIHVVCLLDRPFYVVTIVCDVSFVNCLLECLTKMARMILRKFGCWLQFSLRLCNLQASNDTRSLLT